MGGNFQPGVHLGSTGVNLTEHGDPVAHLPTPSMWPATVGLGVALLGLGFIASLYLVAAGLILMAIGLFGWIQDMRHGG